MENLYEDIKKIFGINKIFIFIVLFISFKIVEGAEYKSLIESLVQLKLQVFMDMKDHIYENIVIDLVKPLLFMLVCFFLFKKIYSIMFSYFLVKTSFFDSVQNLVDKYEFKDGRELKDRLLAQKYNNDNFLEKKNSEKSLHFFSQIIFVFGCFFVFVSYYCGVLDFLLGIILLAVCFFCIIFQQTRSLRDYAKNIAAYSVLNNVSIKKSVSKLLDI